MINYLINKTILEINNFLIGEPMYRFLIVIIFNSVAMQAVYDEYRPEPPYDTLRTLKGNQIAVEAFEKIAQEHPDINFNSYKYQCGYRGWNQNFALYFISNNDGKIKHCFYYNRERKQLEK